MGKNTSETADFRQRAEELVKTDASKLGSLLNDAEMLKLIHELEVHQVELEMQNEELISVSGERKRTEELLKASESRYRRLFESAKDGILILDAETGKIADVNPSMMEMLGYSKNQLLHKAIWKIGFFNGLFANPDKFSEFRRQKYLRYEDLPLETADGRMISVEFVSNSYFEDHKEFIQCNIREITEQKKAHETILKLTKSIEQNPSSIVITDISGNIEYINPKFTEITGYSFDEVKGQNPRLLKSGEMPPEGYKKLWDTISSGEVWRGELHNRKKTGELYWEWATVTSIKNDHGEITNYIAIKEDISLRKQMEGELVIAKEKAEESDRLKSAFLANMSHEIRTPLNSIIGFSDLLGDDDFPEDKKKEFIHHIIINGNNLLHIISDILDISKIESGKIVIRKTKIQVKKLLAEISAMHLVNVEEKNLRLITSFSDAEAEISVLADKERLLQVFNNLISNALKFTSEGFIEIGCKPSGDMVQFHTKDTGIGIPADYHQKVFDRFRQVEAPYARKFGGNGLGLAISKNLVELMGGKIWVESKFGEGSVFFFTLPYTPEGEEKMLSGNVLKKT